MQEASNAWPPTHSQEQSSVIKLSAWVDGWERACTAGAASVDCAIASTHLWHGHTRD